MPSLYLHIPFCEKKCVYCDFYSLESSSMMGEFLNALHNEIDLYADLGAGSSFSTIFFGGGTPSLLTPAQLESILTHLHRKFSIAPDAEVTLETNPGTATIEKLAAFKSLGVNRLSIGIQSFHEDELHFLTRIHDAAQAMQCVKWARQVGFENYSIDLMYALPGQTRERWLQNLDTAMSLAPLHISAYGLIVEDGTPLARMVQSKQVSPAPTDEEAELYEVTMEYMERRGYEHYEVSNYARPGFRSQHNYNYWTHEPYIGFGPSAHSFWKGMDGTARRWWNIAHLSHYCERLQKHELPLVSDEQLSTAQLMTERIFLGLRSDGVDMRRFRKDFGVDFAGQRGDELRDIVGAGLATIAAGSFRLTSKGYLLCDEICARLM
ncbi:MAG: radical SAM family heme chaperone HemW [Bacteroidota bacterium]